ncbi:DUF6285 domain-containing protein [Saccharopolyspora rectivirgula]|uniref:DUF6285 domain-containing protein n=1 Tax=Saccharopolyspora rectivirgula TaxID=28042 RepID=UPI003C6DCA8A
MLSGERVERVVAHPEIVGTEDLLCVHQHSVEVALCGFTLSAGARGCCRSGRSLPRSPRATGDSERRIGSRQAREHRRRLADFGVADQAEFADAIRSGKLDLGDPALLAAVRAAVTDRLAVANPRYLSQPG